MNTTLIPFKARFVTRCSICDRFISTGELIVKYFGWAHEECAIKGEQARETYFRLDKLMQEKHHIAHGVWGIPEGCKETFTHRLWLEKCVEHHEITDDEVRLLKWWWHGSLDHDMAD